VDGGRFLEIKPRWARTSSPGWRGSTVVCGRGGQQPDAGRGVLEVNAADKAARFVNLCDAFEIPLVFLQDVPGFMVGSKVEQQGIIRHARRCSTRSPQRRCRS